MQVLWITYCVFPGVSGNEEIWRTCITDTDMVLGFALGAMFVREAFHGDSKAKVNKHSMR